MAFIKIKRSAAVFITCNLKPMTHSSRSCNNRTLNNVSLRHVDRNRAGLDFRSTTFNALNGIFQKSTSHDTQFDIC